MRLPFAGLWLFTLLLYVRPGEALPWLFGDFPIAKIVAIGALLTYFTARIRRGWQLTIWPLELKMLIVICALGALTMPFALYPHESWEMLTDTFIKVVVIFLLLINLVETRERLRSLMKVVVVAGSFIALDAIYRYLSGQFAIGGIRIAGLVQGMFGNPNDMAIAFNLLLPLALALALNSRGAARVFYLVCLVALVGGVIVTFSRAGFLGLAALSVVLLWKLGRGRQATALVWGTLALGVFVMVAPGSYTDRLATIVSIGQDETGSAEMRRDLLERAATVAFYHPVIGVGMGNYHVYSLHEQVAHNSYLEIAAELGWLGLLAYLALIIKSLRSILRISRETADAATEPAAPEIESEADARRREKYRLSVAIQASLIAYLVCSFFASIQYLWFLYYIVAYAVSLRRIHAAEQAVAAEGEWPERAAQPGARARGTAPPRTRLGLASQEANG